MAEFCLDCWNKINETNYSKSKYILSDDLDLCEECDEWTHVIVVEKNTYYYQKLWYVIFPFEIIRFIAWILIRTFVFSYLFLKKFLNGIVIDVSHLNCRI